MCAHVKITDKIVVQNMNYRTNITSFSFREY